MAISSIIRPSAHLKTGAQRPLPTPVSPQKDPLLEQACGLSRRANQLKDQIRLGDFSAVEAICNDLGMDRDEYLGPSVALIPEDGETARWEWFVKMWFGSQIIRLPLDQACQQLLRVDELAMDWIAHAECVAELETSRHLNEALRACDDAIDLLTNTIDLSVSYLTLAHGLMIKGNILRKRNHFSDLEAALQCYECAADIAQAPPQANDPNQKARSTFLLLANVVGLTADYLPLPDPKPDPEIEAPMELDSPQPFRREGFRLRRDESNLAHTCGPLSSYRPSTAPLPLHVEMKRLLVATIKR